MPFNHTTPDEDDAVERGIADRDLAARFAASIGVAADGPGVTIDAGERTLYTGPAHVRGPLSVVFDALAPGGPGFTLYRSGGIPVTTGSVDAFDTTVSDEDRNTPALLHLAHAALRTYDHGGNLDFGPTLPHVALAYAAALLAPRTPHKTATMRQFPDEDDPVGVALTCGRLRLTAENTGFFVYEAIAWDETGPQMLVRIEEAGHWDPGALAALMIDALEFTNGAVAHPQAWLTPQRGEP